MTVVALILLAWLVLALPVGVLVGRSMRNADDRETGTGARTVVPDFIPAEVLDSVAAQSRGRS